MKIITDRVHVETRGDADIIDLTPKLVAALNQSGLREGQMTVFAPGATAGISTIEYEPGLLKDVPAAMEKIAPSNATYQHDLTWHDGNGHSHVRATLIGPSMTVPFVDGQLTLGTWQQVILLDFDNRPRSRSIVVQLMGE
ncbi:MAG: secondary thiamine-phosphate synthase enzyme YjbQ [Candidatus Hinthialibacter antarcticus]|nr:secondary thiamine-phosphate synthase enzyme YjbQ [Candidatus Hinthialibacter antarcticus]